MIGRNILLASAALSLAAAPVAAQQAKADVQRQSAPVSEQSELAGNTTLFFILGIAAVVAGIILISEDDDPVSE